MPKAVAILDGDSSGLVKSMDDAKVAMQKMEGSGKKLTDQLRDVADEADKAAGALVNKIGGPTAIKAMAGVGAAFAGAGVALGAFSSSMSAFAATQGAAGAKAMADLDTALNELQGQLFTALVGTEDLDEAMNTILGVVDGLKVAFGLLLVPVTAFSALIRQLTTDQSELARTSEGLRKAEVAYQEALAGTKTAFENADKMYGSVQRTLITLLGTKKELAAFELEQQAATIHAAVIAAETAETQRKNAALNLAMDRAEAKERAKASFGSFEAAFPNLARTKIDKARAAAREEAQATIQEQDRGHQEQLARMREALVKLDKMKQEILKAPEEAPVSNRRSNRAPAGVPAGEPVAVEETSEAKMFREMGEYMEKGRKAQAEASAKAYADGLAAHVAAFRAAEAEKEAIRLAGIEKDKADEQAAFDFRKGLAEDLFQVKAKLLVQEMVAGKSATKVAAEMARKAIGDAISAKGDEAMAQAAIYAASFNPMAIPMAAAGVAAYAAAAALGSSAKKASSGTPASAAPAQAAPVNTSFNLRVDAAFADGESIARQFAMMQRSAQRRGLVPVGA